MLPCSRAQEYLTDLELLSLDPVLQERKRLCVFLPLLWWGAQVETGLWEQDFQTVSFLEKKEKRAKLVWEQERGKLELPLRWLVSGVSDHHHVNIIWSCLCLDFLFEFLKLHIFSWLPPWLMEKKMWGLLAHCHPHSCKRPALLLFRSHPPPFFLPSQHLGHY